MTTKNFRRLNKGITLILWAAILTAVVVLYCPLAPIRAAGIDLLVLEILALCAFCYVRAAVKLTLRSEHLTLVTKMVSDADKKLYTYLTKSGWSLKEPEGRRVLARAIKARAKELKARRWHRDPVHRKHLEFLRSLMQ